MTNAIDTPDERAVSLAGPRRFTGVSSPRLPQPGSLDPLRVKTQMIETVNSFRTVGALLRETREAAGLTLRDLAARTRIPSSSLVCLEEDRFAEFPAEVFARGHLRSYARELGLDGDDVLAMYHQQVGSVPAGRPSAPMIQVTPAAPAWNMPEPGRLLRVAYVGAIVALVLGLVITVLAFGSNEDQASASVLDGASFSSDTWTAPAPASTDWRTYRNN